MEYGVELIKELCYQFLREFVIKSADPDDDWFFPICFLLAETFGFVAVSDLAIKKAAMLLGLGGIQRMQREKKMSPMSAYKLMKEFITEADAESFKLGQESLKTAVTEEKEKEEARMKDGKH